MTYSFFFRLDITMARKLLAREELAVDKVYNQEHQDAEQEDSSENLEDTVKKNLQDTKDQDKAEKEIKEEKENAENNDDASEGEGQNTETDSDDNSTNSDSETDSTPDNDDSLSKDSSDSDLKEATECQLLSIGLNVSTENVWDNMQRYAGYLKDIGIEYGKPTLKALGKGILYSSIMSLKGLFYGSKMLIKTTNRAINSYSHLEKKIDELHETIVLLKKNNKTKAATGRKYTKEKIINSIKIGTNPNFVKALIVYRDFLKNYRDSNGRKIVSSISGIKMMMGQVSSNLINPTYRYMSDKEAAIGLKKHAPKGYDAPTEYNDVYEYPVTLPGDLLLIAYLPKEGLTNYDEIQEAYKNSQIFFGKDTTNLTGFRSASYATLTEVEEMLGILKGICENGIEFTKEMRSIERARLSIKDSMKGMLHNLIKKVDHTHEDVEINKFISMKIYFIDKCFLSSISDIEELTRKLIHNYLVYCRESLLEMSKSK